MSDQVTIVIGPDWEAMYVGDEMVFQDHVLEVRDFLHLLPDNSSLKDIDEILLDYDSIREYRYLPKSLEELKRKLDANRE